MLTKLSILIFHKRLMDRTSTKWMQVAIDTAIVLTVLYVLGAFILFGLVSTFSDIWAIVLPQMLISKLRINRRQKIILAGVFSCSIW